MLGLAPDGQATLLYFVGLVAVCCFNTLALLLALKDSNASTVSSSYEYKYRGFKWARCFGYAGLVALQLPLFVARLATHWHELSWIDGAQLLVLALYLATLVSTE